jgi:hypothetical protein
VAEAEVEESAGEDRRADGGDEDLDDLGATRGRGGCPRIVPKSKVI